MFEGPIFSADTAWPAFGQNPGAGSFANAFSTLFGTERLNAKASRPARSDGPRPFIGHCVVSIDTDGNLTLPEFVRRNLVRSGDGLLIAIHDNNNCLTGESICWSERITRRIRENHMGDDTVNAGRDTRRTFGLRQEYLQPGETVRLPSTARALAGIEGSALFIGAGETFEIWSLETALNSADPVLRALAQGAVKIEASLRR